MTRKLNIERPVKRPQDMTTPELVARVEALEGHRRLWRSYAWRLEEKLASNDMVAANEVMTDFYEGKEDEQ